MTDARRKKKKVPEASLVARGLRMLLYGIILVVVVRFSVEYYDAYAVESREVSQASDSIKTCEALVNIHTPDKTLKTGILDLCEQRIAKASRIAIFEAFRTWVERLWICDTLHCSEHVLPIIDYVGDYLSYGGWIGGVLLVYFIYTLINTFSHAFAERVVYGGRQQPESRKCAPLAIADHQHVRLQIEDA